MTKSTAAMIMPGVPVTTLRRVVLMERPLQRAACRSLITSIVAMKCAPAVGPQTSTVQLFTLAPR